MAVGAIGAAQAGALTTMLRHIPGTMLGEGKLGQVGAALASTAKERACHNGGAVRLRRRQYKQTGPEWVGGSGSNGAGGDGLPPSRRAQPKPKARLEYSPSPLPRPFLGIRLLSAKSGAGPVDYEFALLILKMIAKLSPITKRAMGDISKPATQASCYCG